MAFAVLLPGNVFSGPAFSDAPGLCRYSMSEFWSTCLSRLEQELPAQQFNTWIKPLRLEEGASPEEGLRLFAPNGFILKWVRDRYLSRIEELGREFFKVDVSIDLTIGQGSTPVVRPAAAHSTDSSKGNVVAPGASELPASAPRPVAAVKPPSREKTGYEKTRLNAAFTFDNLVVGKANDLARAAAMRVAENPGSDYNPLFIYGGAGLGKTHLIHAIGNRILADRPDKVLRYVHAEDYYQDVVRAYQQKSFDVFKRYYRSVDVLLIDDVQFLNGKNRTQEEFFYAFNALMEAKKQIIITCGSRIVAMSFCEPRS